jgi:threonine dehydrogenase-like Zn-dependent dehydrogenase
MTAGVASIAKGGTIVVVGVFPEKPRIDLAMIGDHELSLIGTLMYKYEDYQRAVELISSGQVITGPLESKHFPFRDYLSAYTYIERQKGESMKVFIDL